MSHHEINTEESINIRNKKPFFDPNLQIHLPTIEPMYDANPKSSHSHAIYSHYSNSFNSEKTPFSTYEAEIKQNMQEAREAHKAWKAMQKKLLEATELILNKK